MGTSRDVRLVNQPLLASRVYGSAIRPVLRAESCLLLAKEDVAVHMPTAAKLSLPEHTKNPPTTADMSPSSHFRKRRSPDSRHATAPKLHPPTRPPPRLGAPSSHSSLPSRGPSRSGPPTKNIKRTAPCSGASVRPRAPCHTIELFWL